MANKLPKGWVEESLVKVSNISSGNSAPQSSDFFTGGSHPFCRTSDVGKIHRSANFSDIKDHLNEKGIRGMRMFPKKTILFPKSGASTLLNHRVSLSVDSYVSSHLATIIPDNTKLVDNYLYYILCTVDAKDIVANSDYPSLKLSDIEKIKILYPTEKKEQEYIVDSLDTLANMIKIRKETIALSKELIPAIFQEMFGDPIKNEKGWETDSLGSLCDVRDGTHDSPKFVNDGYPLITSKNLDNGLINFENVSYLSENDYNKINERSFVDDGDILYAMIGTIGNPVIVKKDREFAIKNVALFKFQEDKNKVINYYINTLLDVITYDFKQKAVGGNQKFVSLGFLRKYTVPVPPLPLQQEFANKVAEINEYIEAQQAELAQFEELFQSTLQKAFTGELTYNFPRKDAK
ncbi:MAG: restriction endonuclease subunit S [Alphaproteobacteria bacterium]